jgi:hypothetical protein
MWNQLRDKSVRNVQRFAKQIRSAQKETVARFAELERTLDK